MHISASPQQLRRCHWPTSTLWCPPRESRGFTSVLRTRPPTRTPLDPIACNIACCNCHAPTYIPHTYMKGWYTDAGPRILCRCYGLRQEFHSPHNQVDTSADREVGSSTIHSSPNIPRNEKGQMLLNTLAYTHSFPTSNRTQKRHCHREIHPNGANKKPNKTPPFTPNHEPKSKQSRKPYPLPRVTEETMRKGGEIERSLKQADVPTDTTGVRWYCVKKKKRKKESRKKKPPVEKHPEIYGIPNYVDPLPQSCPPGRRRQ